MSIFIIKIDKLFVLSTSYILHAHENKYIYSTASTTFDLIEKYYGNKDLN